LIGSRKVTFSIALNWLVAIGVGAVGLIALYILMPSWRTELLFIAPVLGGSAALVAAFNAIDSRAAQGRHSRKTISLEFVHCWLAPTLHHAKKNSREIVNYLRDHPQVEEQKKYLTEDPTRLANLFDVLNIFEAMSITVQQEMADEEVLKLFFRSLVVEYWHASVSFVKARRAERQNVRLLKEVEWLFNRWNS